MEFIARVKEAEEGRRGVFFFFLEGIPDPQLKLPVQNSYID